MLRLLAAMVLLLPGAGLARAQSITMDWTAVDSINVRLPVGIRVFAGVNDHLPLRAWFVRMAERDPRIETRVKGSADVDGKETVSEFAADPNVCIAVNAGYFDMNADPARHVGLLLSNARVLSDATGAVTRDERTYPTARAALGFTADGNIEIEWATNRSDSVFAWAGLPAHKVGSVDSAPAPDPTPWSVRDAVGAGPMILRNGVPTITVDGEVFFGSSIPNTHPRTAAGRTDDGDLVVMVVDGRQDLSRGVTLEELADLMAGVGVVDALNLDGGGSSALVVLGTRLNRPVGGDVERQVVSALVTTCPTG